MNELVKVTGLNVVVRNNEGAETTIVKDVSFTIGKGQVLALIGESGSGKTTIALALMRYARRSCHITKGSVIVGETDIMTVSDEQLHSIRGRRISYVAQSAASAFNPSKTIMNQIIEAAMIHGLMSRSKAEAKAVDLFRALALPNPDSIGKRYPHQLSGGQLQRLMAAMALITDPELVIFDEPTTALDVTTQIDVLRAFKRVIEERGITAVYVSHDLAVVAQMADKIVVLNHGEIREVGATEQVLQAPEDDYTKTLMAAAKPIERHESGVGMSNDTLLEISGLVAGYGKVQDGVPAIPVLRDIDLTIRRGATVGVIGESGSGKSTLARVIAGLLPPASGKVLLDGQPLPPGLAERTREQFRRVQIVFQNADTALNPSHTVGRILARPLAFYHGLKGEAAAKRVRELLELVQLPAAVANKPCGRLSGGQKQRINLARALAADPELILCDEVTSALDTVVAAAILDLMADLRRELNVSYMFISHDISTVRSVCDDIVVLYAGHKVEHGSRETFISPPFHPYTDMLINSVPELDTSWLEHASRAQTLPPLGQDQGSLLCPFRDRCSVRIDGTCNTTPPPRHILLSGNEVLCHHEESALKNPAPVAEKLKQVI